MFLELLIATVALTPDLDRRVLDSEQVVLGRVERVFDFPAGELRH